MKWSSSAIPFLWCLHQPRSNRHDSKSADWVLGGDSCHSVFILLHHFGSLKTLSIFNCATTEVKSQVVRGLCALPAFSFLHSDTCCLSTVLMTDQDLLLLSWDCVTTTMTFPIKTMKNSSFIASNQHPLRSSSVSETKQLWFLYCHFHPAKLSAKPCACGVAFSCLLHNLQPQNRVWKAERLQSEWQGRESRCLHFYYVPFNFIYCFMDTTFCGRGKPT